MAQLLTKFDTSKLHGVDGTLNPNKQVTKHWCTAAFVFVL